MRQNSQICLTYMAGSPTGKAPLLMENINQTISTSYICSRRNGRCIRCNVYVATVLLMCMKSNIWKRFKYISFTPRRAGYEVNISRRPQISVPLESPCTEILKVKVKTLKSTLVREKKNTHWAWKPDPRLGYLFRAARTQKIGSSDLKPNCTRIMFASAL